MIEYFTYLDVLRESGVTNMYGATPYLQDEFRLPEDKARRIVQLWIKTFGDQSVGVRAAEAMELK